MGKLKGDEFQQMKDLESFRNLMGLESAWSLLLNAECLGGEFGLGAMVGEVVTGHFPGGVLF